MMASRRCMGAIMAWALCIAYAPVWAQTDEDKAWAALQRGAIVVFRHTIAPGGGDPPGWVIGDCTTQRNLDAAGRQQAKSIGDRLRAQNVMVSAVWASQWCRTRETAQIAFPAGPAIQDQSAFNSFFEDRSREPAQTAQARRQLLGWRGSGALVIVSHQVNIAALTGVSPEPGEGVVLERSGTRLNVVGRIKP
jgi:phosphohistidine phosphatase SixA